MFVFKKNKIIVWILIIGWFVSASYITPHPERVTQPQEKLYYFAGVKIPLGGINKSTILVSWFIIALLILLAVYIAKRIKTIPSRPQLIMELFISAFDNLCTETLGKKGRKYLPLVVSLFLFIAVSNMIAIFPVPGFISPTQDLNTPLGLGLLCFFIAHASGIKYRGFKNYIKGYFEPYPILFPLNFIGEIAKVISHSFRLFWYFCWACTSFGFCNAGINLYRGSDRGVI